MQRLNFWLTLSSISVLIVTAERFSPTTRITLQPYGFLRLHEVLQMVVIILSTVLIPFMVYLELSSKNSAPKGMREIILSLLFITGIYFYSTGNGVHETAGYIFNSFCDTADIAPGFCGSSFFNDYYFGNILYFIGGYLMTLVLLLLERNNPPVDFDRKNRTILSVNAVVFAFAIFAYSAFDRVLVGLIYSLVTTFTILLLLVTSNKKYNQLPYTTYALATYALGTTASLIVRFFL
jgi:hypothetical protein